MPGSAGVFPGAAVLGVQGMKRSLPWRGAAPGYVLLRALGILVASAWQPR